MVKVKKSKIHGRGLFSTKKIKKNQIIGKYKVVKTKKTECLYNMGWEKDV